MFQFKQFAIQDQHSAMKIGTDGILLGSWLNTEKANTILDIGAGTGVIAIMCAQKNQVAQITALELDDSAVIDAQQNIQNCPWNNRIHLIHSSLQEFEAVNSQFFDCIVSNPPFFENSQKSVNEARIKARHTDTLHFSDILLFAQKWLTDEGRLSLILPTEHGLKALECSVQFDLNPISVCEVFPIPSKPPHRLLIEFGRKINTFETEKNQLIIETGLVRHEYTEDYQKLCKEFYLRF